jgi:hypothetical protein
MKRRLFNWRYILLGLAALQGCTTTQGETPEGAIASAKQFCSRVLRNINVPLTWKASLSGENDENWSVIATGTSTIPGDPNSYNSYGVGTSWARGSTVATPCTEIILKISKGNRNGGSPPQP